MSNPQTEGNWTASIDGASRGNPGPAAAAVVIRAADGSRVASFANCLGRATNNFAEYQALLAALQYALAHQQRRLQVRSDSELLVRQIQGSYQVKNAGLRVLYHRANKLIGNFDAFSIQHVPREANREADRLANRALDAGQNVELKCEAGDTQS